MCFSVLLLIFSHTSRIGAMRIDFGSSGLDAVFTSGAGKIRLPIGVINSLRKKLILLDSAPDERTLRNWKSLHYEKLQGDRSHQRSIRINNQWRLIFQILENQNSPTLLIVSVEDYH